jgi:uncharacterized protein YneF (UPF0154 family)
MLKLLGQIEEMFQGQRRKPSASLIRQVLAIIDAQSSHI